MFENDMLYRWGLAFLILILIKLAAKILVSIMRSINGPEFKLAITDHKTKVFTQNDTLLFELSNQVNWQNKDNKGTIFYIGDDQDLETLNPELDTELLPEDMIQTKLGENESLKDPNIHQLWHNFIVATLGAGRKKNNSDKKKQILPGVFGYSEITLEVTDQDLDSYLKNMLSKNKILKRKIKLNP